MNFLIIFVPKLPKICFSAKRNQTTGGHPKRCVHPCIFLPKAQQVAGT